jgi:SAM-dependent methyltransferase
MSILWKIANNRDPASLASRLRNKRFDQCREIILSMPRPVRVLDVGGGEGEWKLMGLAGIPDVFITLLNIEPMPVAAENIVSVVGDARDLKQFRAGEFDFVFSNSVIEHVGGDQDIERMASEIRRVGNSYYIQTPNRYFPIEPHFLFPFFQFLPVALRATLVQHFKLGWSSKMPDRRAAEREVRSVNLLTRRQMTRLFPDASTVEERVLGFPKSIQSIRLA